MVEHPEYIKKIQNQFSSCHKGDLFALIDLQDTILKCKNKSSEESARHFFSLLWALVEITLRSGDFDLLENSFNKAFEAAEKGSLEAWSENIISIMPSLTTNYPSEPLREAIPQPTLSTHLPNITEELLRIFINDTEERLLQTEALILHWEETNDKEAISQLFRIFHTVKGESTFLGFSGMKTVSHLLEALFEKMKSGEIRKTHHLTDSLLKTADSLTYFLKILKSEGLSADKNFNFPEVEAELEILLSGELPEESPQLPGEKETAGIQENKDEFIRVRSSYINQLNDRIQELWIAENNISTELIHPLRKITREIQALAIKLRTVKLSRMEPRLKRIIRDLSQHTGKEILFSFHGGDIEVDRNLVEAMEEPLMHIIRNSVDHGIEPGDERLQSGKDKQGHISIYVKRKGSSLTVTAEDDGRGIDIEKVAQTAVKRGIISQEEAFTMSDSDKIHLIFSPGFSTAENVTDISGRGIGVDIVKAMTDKLNGKLDITTEPGYSTRVTISIPVNTTILEGLIVRICSGYYVLPVVDIKECLNIDPSHIKSVNNLKVLELRGKILPILDMKNVTGICKKGPQSRISGLVILHHNREYILLVDAIENKTEVAIKPLTKMFSKLKGISSWTIFSGGKIGFVLDLYEIIQQTERNQGGNSE